MVCSVPLPASENGEAPVNRKPRINPISPRGHSACLESVSGERKMIF